MKILIAFLCLCVSSGVLVEAGQVKWETNLESAKVRAEKEGKPILLFHMFGRLDEEFT